MDPIELVALEVGRARREPGRDDGPAQDGTRPGRAGRRRAFCGLAPNARGGARLALFGLCGLSGLGLVLGTVFRRLGRSALRRFDHHGGYRSRAQERPERTGLALLGGLLATALFGWALPSDATAAGAPRPRLPRTGTPLHGRLPQGRPIEIQAVLDGDTLLVLYEGKEDRLRLACVDTEEKILGRAAYARTKPETLFGEETAHWARAFLAGQPRSRLAFHGEEEERDAFGRLLGHLVLADGTDFNVLLVRTGRSPYFMKYGFCPIAHLELEEGQRLARKERLGVFDPKTNRARRRGGPEARRPYAELEAWWRGRARAIEGFRRLQAEHPGRVAAAGSPRELARAARQGEETGAEVWVFGTVARIFKERDGSRTVLFRSASNGMLRAEVPARAWPQVLGAVDLPGTMGELRENHVYARGRVRREGRGFRLRAGDASDWVPGQKPSGLELAQ